MKTKEIDENAWDMNKWTNKIWVEDYTCKNPRWPNSSIECHPPTLLLKLLEMPNNVCFGLPLKWYLRGIEIRMRMRKCCIKVLVWLQVWRLSLFFYIHLWWYFRPFQMQPLSPIPYPFSLLFIPFFQHLSFLYIHFHLTVLNYFSI